MSHPSAKLVKFPSIETPENVFPHLVSASRFVRFDRKTKTLIYDKELPLPVLTFRGTVKLHGANCAIVQTRLSKEQKATHFQSRNKVVTSEVAKDYMGFANHMSQHNEVVGEMFGFIFGTRSQLNGKKVEPEEITSIAVYGEWCGGNIQKNIGLSQFEKMFVVFAVKINYHSSASRRKPDDQQEWMDMSLLRDLHNEKAHIFNVHQFDTFEVTIDFGKEKSKQEGLRLMEDLTFGVQKECPVAKKLGAKETLINGEGIVWQVIRVVSPVKSGSPSNLRLERFTAPGCWMKTREIKPTPPSTSRSSTEQRSRKPQSVVEVSSRKHAAKKTLQQPHLVISWPTDESPSIDSPSVDSLPVKPLSVNSLSMDSLFSTFSSIDALISFIAPEWRLGQGLHYMDHEMKLPRDVRCVGPYIEWVVNDVFKEQSNRVERSGFGRKEVAAAVGAMATKWYLSNLEGQWWALRENMAVGA